VLDKSHYALNPYQFGLGGTPTQNSQAILAALDVAASGYHSVVLPSGAHTINQTIGVPSNVEFFGQGKFASTLVQESLNTPSVIVSTPSGSEYQNIHDIGVRYNHDAIGSSTQVGFKLAGTRRATLKDCSVDNLGQSVANYSGIGILIDMGSVANAYTHRIEGNTVLGSTYGIWSKGPLTSTVFTKNHFKTLHGMRFDRDNVLAGTTVVFGNQIYGNLIQAHSSATFGLGNGLDFGQSDGALGFTYASSNQIGWNYIEQFQNGILLRDGAKNFDIASQSWDNAANEIVDLNPDKSGYSGFDAENFRLSTRQMYAEFTPQGLKVVDKKTNVPTYQGVSKTLDVDSDGFVITTTDAHKIRIWGDGAVRTGAVLSRASAVDGQKLVLIGFSWSVSLSTTGILFNGGIGVALGNGSGQVARIEFEYDSSLDLWVECSRNTRA